VSFLVAIHCLFLVVTLLYPKWFGYKQYLLGWLSFCSYNQWKTRKHPVDPFGRKAFAFQNFQNNSCCALSISSYIFWACDKRCKSILYNTSIIQSSWNSWANWFVLTWL
jgi:hypothetical protein